MNSFTTHESHLIERAVLEEIERKEDVQRIGRIYGNLIDLMDADYTQGEEDFCAICGTPMDSEGDGCCEDCMVDQLAATLEEPEDIKLNEEEMYMYNGYKDSVGGYHDEGLGWNPKGVFCGECVALSCKGCVNQNKGEDHGPAIFVEWSETKSRFVKSEKPPASLTVKHSEMMGMLLESVEEFKRVNAHRRAHRRGMMDDHVKRRTLIGHIEALRRLLKVMLRDMRELRDMAAKAYDEIETQMMWKDASYDIRRDAEQSIIETEAEMEAERRADASMYADEFDYEYMYWE